MFFWIIYIYILNFSVLNNCMNVVVGFVFHMRSILLDLFFNFVVQFQLNYFICCQVMSSEICFIC